MTPRAVTLAAKDLIEITLPWAVVITDNRKSVARNGKVRNTKAYTVAKDNAHMIACLAVKRQRVASGPVVVCIRAFPPDNVRRDLTNILKLICDALSGTAFSDDNQITELTIARDNVDRTNPRVEITVEAL